MSTWGYEYIELWVYGVMSTWGYEASKFSSYETKGESVQVVW